ncbi:hypothetical protein IC575_003879 [Cucumis melo]
MERREKERKRKYSFLRPIDKVVRMIVCGRFHDRDSCTRHVWK